jgi:hypothetical protein
MASSLTLHRPPRHGGREPRVAVLRSARASLRVSLLGALVAVVIGASGARAEDDRPSVTAQPELVKQANAPISSILQLRLLNSYLPELWDVPGQANTFSIAVTMPFPRYRLLPFPQLSLLTLPVAVTVPGDVTAFGDVRLANIAVFELGPIVLGGLGATLVFPTAQDPLTGQGKWQAGPAAAIAVAPERWLLGVFAQNPISFAGDGKRADTNALFLQPFATYRLGGGWFIRSQPQMVFDWKTKKSVTPIDLGVGRVFKIGRQDVSLFVGPFWNVSREVRAPRYGITFGASLLYPDFWRGR